MLSPNSGRWIPVWDQELYEFYEFYQRAKTLFFCSLERCKSCSSHSFSTYLFSVWQLKGLAQTMTGQEPLLKINKGILKIMIRDYISCWHRHTIDWSSQFPKNGHYLKKIIIRLVTRLVLNVQNTEHQWSKIIMSTNDDIVRASKVTITTVQDLTSGCKIKITNT